MKMRLIPPAAAPGAWRVAGRSAAGAVLLAVTVSACTGGSSSVPSIFTPSPTTSGQSVSPSGTRTPSPAGGGTSRPAGGSSAGASASRSASASSSPHTSISSRPAVSPTATATRTQAAAPTHTATATPTAAPTHTSAVSPAFPTAAPETGGGGTAGLQDGLLFGVGGAAVLAGIGALALRRRLARKFGTSGPAPRDRERVDR